MKGVRAMFGHDKMNFPWTFGLTKKGGMDYEEYEKFQSINVIPLYPDACDMMSKCIFIKINSKSGSMNPELMTWLFLLGFYIFLCVPNSTWATQKTVKKYMVYLRHNFALIEVSAALIDCFLESVQSLDSGLLNCLFFGGKILWLGCIHMWMHLLHYSQKPLANFLGSKWELCHRLKLVWMTLKS